MIKAFFTGDIVNTKGTDFLNKDLVDKIREFDISGFLRVCSRPDFGALEQHYVVKER